MGKFSTPASALKELGQRIKAHRISYPLSQIELAEKSGLSIRSISRIEQGEDLLFGSLIRILVALDLDANVEMLVPDSSNRPSFQLSVTPKKRYRRQTKPKDAHNPDERAAIKWGDES